MSPSLIDPYKSFVRNLITEYFSTNEIIKGFFIAILLSNFIFLSIFESLALDFISPFLAMLGFYLLFLGSRKCFFYSGFFIGILWFYWISFSLRFSGLSFLIPVVILLIALVYALIFLVCGWFKSLFLRAILLVLTGYFYPFNFNWLNLELTLMPGIFEPNLRGLVAVFLSIVAFIKLKNFKFLAIFLLLFGLQFSEKEYQTLPFKTKISETNISQDIKWESEFKNAQINEVLKEINLAIDGGFEFIILPENAIVAYLNKEENLLKVLKEKSLDIAILTGALAYENKTIYNSSYLFSAGGVQRFDKLILVPFGEEIPLPNFIKDFINYLVFDGASDFGKAEDISEYKLNGVKITNAICYEATRPEIYKNNPKFVVAISNNGWFMPSSQPILQKILIKYYATKHATSVYHSVNASKSEIITPKKMWIREFYNLLIR